jgi:hypothetical protein
MTYSSQEQSTNNLIVWSLRPWLRRWENAFFDILPQARYVKFDVDDLVRVDQGTRYANYKIARDSGWLVADEIRDTEDRPPLKGGIGQEALGGDVLVSMSRGLGVLPKSFAAQVVAPQEAVPGYEPKGTAGPPPPGEQQPALPPGQGDNGAQQDDGGQEQVTGQGDGGEGAGGNQPRVKADPPQTISGALALIEMRKRAEPGDPSPVKPALIVPPRHTAACGQGWRPGVLD